MISPNSPADISTRDAGNSTATDWLSNDTVTFISNIDSSASDEARSLALGRGDVDATNSGASGTASSLAHLHGTPKLVSPICPYCHSPLRVVVITTHDGTRLTSARCCDCDAPVNDETAGDEADAA